MVGIDTMLACDTMPDIPHLAGPLMAFGRALPRIRKRVARDLRRGQPEGRDRVLAAIVQQIDTALRHRQDLPDLALLQQEGTGSTPHPISPADIDNYLHEAAGARFTAGDFRRWHGSVLALARAPGCPHEPAARRPRRGLLADEQQLLRFLRQRGKQARIDPWLPKRAAKRMARGVAASG